MFDNVCFRICVSEFNKDIAEALIRTVGQILQMSAQNICRQVERLDLISACNDLERAFVVTGEVIENVYRE